MLLILVMSMLLAGGNGQLSDCDCSSLSCPDGWLTYNGACYYISDNVNSDWTVASHHCDLHSANLVIIDTKEEDEFLKNQLERMYRTDSQHQAASFWIGATNTNQTAGQWVSYLENEPLTYTGWNSGEPQSNMCAAITSGLVGGKYAFTGWSALPCTQRHQAICEILYK